MEPNITVFIADDNRSIREMSKRVWKTKGVKAECFESGNTLVEALQNALQNAGTLPTAALVDFVMDGGGEALVERLHEAFPDLPVIVYTGLDTPGSMRAFNMGAYAVMQKPLDFNELHDILKELNNREKLFIQLAKDAMSIVKFETAIVWQCDKSKKNYKVAGWAGELDMDFERTFTLNIDEYPRISALKNGKITVIEDIQKFEAYKDKAEAEKRNWKSLITIPLLKNNRLIGWVDCYKLRQFFIKTADPSWPIKEDFLKIFAHQAAETVHSTTLTEQLRILHETSQNLSGTLDYNLIYDTILAKAQSVTGADCGWIYEYDNGEKVLKIGDTFGLSHQCADDIRALDGGGITGYVAKMGTSIYVPDIRKESDAFTPEMYIPISDHEVRSVLAIPLRRSDRTLGVLTLKSVQVDFFTQEDSQLMTSLAAVAALSMERSKLTKHLSEISKLAQEAIDFGDLAQYVVDAVRDLTDSDVNLWMSSKVENEGDEWMRIVRSSKSNKDPKYQDYIDHARAPIRYGSSLIAQALYERRHVIVPDLFKHNQEPPFFNIERIKEFDWHSFMTIPLIGKKGEPLGAISLFSTKINRFSDDDGLLVQHFANQAALALQEQRHIAVLQELTQIGQDLTVGLPGAHSLSKRVAHLAQKISKADFTVIYPFDTENNDFYDKTLCAHAGELRRSAKEITNRPRTNGMADFVREHGLMAIEMIENGAISLKVGRSPVDVLPQHSDYKKVLGFVQKSKIIADENIRAFVGIALSAVEQQKGKSGASKNLDVAVLYINFRAPHWFTDEDLQVLNIFSHQVANIIHRNRLFDSVSRQRKLLESLSSSATHIMASQDNQERLENIVEEAVNLLKAKGGKVYLTVNGSRQDLKLVAVRGIDTDDLRVGSVMPKNAGMAGKVVRSKKPQSTEFYPGYQYSVPSLRMHFSSVLEVPMMIGHEVIGVLSVFDDRSNKIFRKNDQDLLQRLADQAALAIFKSRLTDELDALYQTSKQITAQADPKELAEIILKELRKIIGYDRASFQVFKNEHEGRTILAVEGENIGHADDKLHRPLVEDALVWPVFENQKPFVLSDTRKDTRWDSNIKVTRKIRSWACIPLIYDGKVLAIITLDHFIAGYYQTEDVVKLERFADLAAIALHNTTIDQRHLTELQKFASRVTKIGPDDTVDKVFLDSVNILEEVLKPSRYLFHYQDEAYFAKRRRVLEHFPPSFSHQPLAVGEGLAGWVAQEAEAMLYPDDFDKKLFPELVIQPSQSLFFAPIWREGKVVGIIEIEAKASEYDHNRKQFLSILILQASLAVQQIEQRERRSVALRQRFNPYILGTPVRNPDHFFGRAEILEGILAGINNNNYAVVDDRRLGKTSLLFRLEYEMKYHLSTVQKEVLPVYFSLEGVTPDAFYPLMINKIRQAFDLNNIEIAHYVEYGYHAFRRDLDALKAALLQEQPTRKAIAVLLIDEIDALNEYPDIMQRQFRAILVEEHLLRVVMAGFKVDFKETSLTSPWYNFLKILKIGPFSTDDAKELIVKSVQGYYVYQEEAIELILEKSQLRPRDIQYYCSEALTIMFRRLSKAGPDELAIVTLDDVERVRPEQPQTDYNI